MKYLTTTNRAIIAPTAYMMVRGWDCLSVIERPSLEAELVMEEVKESNEEDYSSKW